MSIVSLHAGNLAWCALVALNLAKSDGRVKGHLQENIFLYRWLTSALKQHRFPREIAPHIRTLLSSGTGSNLRASLEYLWKSCSGKLMDQSHLFRLTYALENIDKKGYKWRLVDDKEWKKNNNTEIKEMDNIIYLSRSLVDFSFDKEGKLMHPFHIKIYGDVKSINEFLSHYGWRAIKLNIADAGHQDYILETVLLETR